MQKILLLEDDKSLNRGITLTLQKAGYAVTSAFTLAEAKDCLEKLREIGDTYFIYLTALDSEIDIVNGYDAGADDYITKPFSLMVLVSKVNALMRRIDSTKEYKSIMVCGDLELNCREMKVYQRGREVSLSKKELQLLTYLWENGGQIVSKDSILEHVWDVDGQFVDENTVTVNISRLKNKLGTDAISNVRGLGYIWTETVIRK